MAIGSPLVPDDDSLSGDPRDRLLSAAGREFAERGYESATVRDICLAAGVNVAAVNYYFGDKRRLYIESVKHAHRERMRQVPLPEVAEDSAPEGQLHAFIDTMLERMIGVEQPPWQVRLMLREILNPTEACRELVEDYFRPHFALLVAILDRLAEGRLGDGELRRIGLSIIGQCFLYRAAGDVVGMLVPPDELASLHQPRPLAAHVTRFALAALGKGPPLVPPPAGAPVAQTPRIDSARGRSGSRGGSRRSWPKEGA